MELIVTKQLKHWPQNQNKSYKDAKEFGNTAETKNIDCD